MPIDSSMDKWERAETACPKCGSSEYYWRIHESDDEAYEDVQYFCRDCHYVRWIDGIDS